MAIAPVVLFVYNRPWHTRQTIEALIKNKLSEKTDLFIFSDAAKDDSDLPLVEEVRDYIKGIEGFKSIHIIKRKENWGLAKSIIEGVTDVINKYGKVIVIEDDIVTSPLFLEFMNQALDFYQNKKKVWHVSGWNYPIDSNGLGDAFLWRVMNCWGWATWSDRWMHFEKAPEKLITQWSAEEKYRFDLDDSGVFWNQVEENAVGKINTWAIFWYATIFANKGLCLNPSISFVENIGHDGSGVNCGKLDNQYYELSKVSQSNFPTQIQECALAVKKIKRHLSPSLISRIIRKVRTNAYK